MSAPVPTADLIMLVGFMGAGKSTVGRLLARRLGRCFVETDDMIVAREGRSIPDIFGESGEARFRELEAEVLESLGLKRGDVIATGGGLPCREGRMAQLRLLGTVYRAAHLVIETRGLGVDQVVGRILRVLPQSHGARV